MDKIGTGGWGGWFLSVVVTGLLINLASAYLKPRVDGVLLRSSGWWRSRSAVRIERRRKEVEALRDPDQWVIKLLSACSDAVFGLLFLMLTIVSITLGSSMAGLGLKSITDLAIVLSMMGVACVSVCGVGVCFALFADKVDLLKEARKANVAARDTEPPVPSSSAPPTEPH